MIWKIWTALLRGFVPVVWGIMHNTDIQLCANLTKIPFALQRYESKTGV